MTLVRLAVEGKTDIGLFRQENEDCIRCHQDAEHPFAYVVLADGMGGQRGGAMASAIATEIIQRHLDGILTHQFLSSAKPAQEELLRTTMQRAMRWANGEILDAKKSSPEYAQMGTTVVAAAVWQDFLVVTHLGDSRAYLWSDSGIRRLTRDDSYVQELIDSGHLTEEEGRRSSLRNQITGALGIAQDISPSINSWHLQDYSLLLLCSDGVTDYLDDRELEHILASHRPALACTHRFIDAANRMGGKDNISAGMIEFEPLAHESPPARFAEAE